MSSHVKQRFHIYTLGCKVNQYETQSIRESMCRAGFAESEDGGVADVYIVNSCTVTGEADRESRNMIAKFHRHNPDARIVLTGCLAEGKDAGSLSLPGVTSVISNSDKNRIPGILADKDDMAEDPVVTELAITDFKGHSRAFVKIQDGCENRCSYCKVPLVRGRSRSRQINEIASEVKTLVDKGFHEVVLTGICLGAWGKDLVDMPASGSDRIVTLLERLCSVKGDFRIRLSSIEPRYVTDRLLRYISSNSRICPHLHIPFQSGDDVILRLMNRPYTSGMYISIVEMARAIIPDVAVTTDILLSFPGETNERFDNTMEFVKRIAPARAHIFTFSKREGTAAYGMQCSILPSVKKERYQRMSALVRELQEAYTSAFLGKIVSVLVENEKHEETGRFKGYSEHYIKVLFDGSGDLSGRVVRVRATHMENDRLIGECVRSGS